MENQEPSAGSVINSRGRPIQQPRRRRRVLRRQIPGNAAAAGSAAAAATAPATAVNNNTTTVSANTSSATPATVASTSQSVASSSQSTVVTGKRLAKRSIIGTRVCAPGNDGKYYCGAISAVNTPTSPQQPELAGLSITPNTRYSVRFDPVPPGCKAPDSKTEFMDVDLIGPGFGSVTTAKLVQGQRVYLTYNGREIQAEVLEHREHNDEVQVVFTPPGQEGAITLSRRIDEVRLLESRKSARLADTDTDFARLADMGSDRKRGSTHTIEVPQVYGSRKRRTSSNSDSNYNWVEIPRTPQVVAATMPTTTTTTNPLSNGTTHADSGNKVDGGNCMDECSAAMVLMSLSTPPKHPLPYHCQDIYGPWEDHHRVNRAQQRPARASPVVVGSSSSNSSWRTGTPSPLLSDQGTWTGSNSSASNGCTDAPGPSRESHHRSRYDPYGNSRRSSPYDEGIVSDLENERHPRKKRCKAEPSDECVNGRTSSPSSPSTPSPRAESTTDNEVEAGNDAIPRKAIRSAKRTRSAAANKTVTNKTVRNRTVVAYKNAPRKRALCCIPSICAIAAGMDPNNPEPIVIYKCTWRNEGDTSGACCGEIGHSWEVVAEHVFTKHLKNSKEYENEEDFYIVDETLYPTCSPPTKSHWDMVRPRSEDPEYQEQIRLAAAATNNTVQNHNQVAATINTRDIIIRDVFSIAQQQQGPPSKQFKPTPRPLQAYNSNVNVLTVSIGKMPSAPRRARGDTKKCRKVYGMEHKELWCTQCKWKKACTRFND